MVPLLLSGLSSRGPRKQRDVFSYIVSGERFQREMRGARYVAQAA